MLRSEGGPIRTAPTPGAPPGPRSRVHRLGVVALLTVALLALRSDDMVGTGIVLAGALLALVPSLVVYLSLQKSFLRGITTGAIKG